MNDIIENSYGKPYIKMSKEIYEAIVALKQFNYDNIYSKANTEEEVAYYKKGFNSLFDKYLKDIEYNNEDSDIYVDFISKQNAEYLNNTNHKRIVIDFLAGMTDDYFISHYNKLLNE